MRSNRKNNKGFSLVELIIVIAIMAVLVGTLAPQYLRYVEKSRLAADKTLEEQFITSLEVLAADADANLATDGTYTITSDTSGNITFSQGLQVVKTGTTTTKTALYAELVDVNKKYSYKSKEYTGKARTIALSYSATDNAWTVKVTVAN